MQCSYQVPPLIAGRTGIVVSPLLSLMQDQVIFLTITYLAYCYGGHLVDELLSNDWQVMALKQRGIEAEYLGTTQTDKTVQSKAESGLYSLLFMTPERACTIPNRCL